MTHTGSTRRGRWIGVLTGCAVLIAAAGPAAAVRTAQPSGADTSGHDAPAASGLVPAQFTNSKCTPAERRRTLAAEQRRVLTFFKDFLVLRNEADVARLAEPRDGVQFFVLSHAYNSIRGMGLSIINGGEVSGPGKPAMLLYRPSRGAADVTDPDGPDFPYTLAGWGYAGLYAPGQPPSFAGDPGLRCLTKQDWLVHERSVHPSDTWQNIPVPPEEQWHGQALGAVPPTPDECDTPCVGVGHPRLWDLHLFIGNSGVPAVSMLNPGKPIPGFDPGVGVGFFYPQRYPSTGAVPPAAGHGHSGHH
ncbi:hypothetical protein [Winogradskya consettensis]|uniref:hypothetical protein n=1 Tax=Winogradskya consettensis TaxID=113560 RepID=UPI001BB436AC|nr:hypothetical protein [Actinoplanes consettensis]